MIQNPTTWLDSIYHAATEKYLSNPNPGFGESIDLLLRIAELAPVKEVYVRICPDGEQQFVKMENAGSQPGIQWWRASLKIEQPILHYRFVLVSTDGVWFYNANGVSMHDPLDRFDFRLLTEYQPISWLADAVFYQIFPDRFANGDHSINPHPGEFEFHGFRSITLPWGLKPPQGSFNSLVFYSGDLPGIAQKLGYLQELGANAIYLNPVFTANTNHKYDVVDYEHVDPHLGGDEALAILRKALSERNMHYILDIVPNHCGFWHPWFQTARADPISPEASFFTFSDHPDEYASWLGVWLLPKLNYRSEELRQRIYLAEDSVFRRWLNAPFSADGWRVDVANMLARQGRSQMGNEIAAGIRDTVKITRPDAYLIGENFFDASEQLQGNQWDGVMNYSGFLKPLLHWLRMYKQGGWRMAEEIKGSKDWETSALITQWRERLAAIPWVIALQQYNLLGSHDVPRIIDELGGNQVLHRLAAVIQFSYPGVPGIYYGDEIGMKNIPGLDQRGCMEWDSSKWDHDLLRFYQRLISLRRGSEALRSGGFQILHFDDDLIVYQREGASERFLTIANRNQYPINRPIPVWQGGIVDGTRFVEQFSGQELKSTNGKLELIGYPQGATLWKET